MAGFEGGFWVPVIALAPVLLPGSLCLFVLGIRRLVLAFAASDAHPGLIELGALRRRKEKRGGYVELL